MYGPSSRPVFDAKSDDDLAKKGAVDVPSSSSGWFSSLSWLSIQSRDESQREAPPTDIKK